MSWREGLGLLVAGLVMPFAVAAQGVAVYDECPSDSVGCVVMNLDAPDLPAILLSEVPTDREQMSDFTVAVEGSFDGGTPGTVSLTVTGFVGGIECSAFGQANVAVLGFAAEGRPILATSMGAFTLVGDALRVGCPDCARRLSEQGARLPAATLPAWDLASVSVPEWNVGFDGEGNLFVSQSGRCLKVPTVGMIEAVDARQCTPSSLSGMWMDPPEGVDLQPGERLLEVERTEVRLVLNVGACT